MVSMRRLVLVGLASPLSALHPAPMGPHDAAGRTSHNMNVGRRALLFGAAATLGTTIQPANALSTTDLEDVMTRAKNSQLSTDGVIFRALNDDLIRADEITSCKSLEEIYKIDTRAAQEVRIANDVLLKLSAAEKKNAGFKNNLPARVNPAAIDDAYEIGRIVEQRISSRASAINVKFTLDCQIDPAASYKDKTFRTTNVTDTPDKFKEGGNDYRSEDRPGKESDPAYRYRSEDRPGKVSDPAYRFKDGMGDFRTDDRDKRDYYFNK